MCVKHGYMYIILHVHEDICARISRVAQRYDEEEKLGTPQRVCEWIARVLQQQVPQPVSVNCVIT